MGTKPVLVATFELGLASLEAKGLRGCAGAPSNSINSNAKLKCTSLPVYNFSYSYRATLTSYGAQLSPPSVESHYVTTGANHLDAPAGEPKS
jgi:hypothetical protein